jgi:hypothetical protein
VSGEVALGPGTTVKFGEVAVLFEPLDDTAPVRRSSGTQVVSAAIPGSGADSASGEAASASQRPRRPIRASTPRPSGPPAWLIATLVVIGAAVAFFLLR